MGKRKIFWPIVIFILFIFAILYSLPTFVSEDDLPSFYHSIFSKKLNFGLDLKGGLELRYTVDYKKAMNDNTLRAGEDLSRILINEFARKEGKNPEELTDEEKNNIKKRFTIERETYKSMTVTFVNSQDMDILSDDFIKNHVDANLVRLGAEGNVIHLEYSDNYVASIRNSVVDQSLEIFRKRVEAFGLVEPDIRRNGDTDIDVQLPDVSKEQMDMVRERIGQTAQLTFRIVDRSEDGKSFFKKLEKELGEFKQKNPEKSRSLAIALDPTTGQWFLKSEKKNEILSFLKEVKIPDDHTVGFELVEKKDGNIVKERYYRTFYLFGKAEVTGDHLTRSYVQFERAGEPFVSLEFDAEGARLFEDTTRKNVGEYMAIMLDEEINSAPVIKEVIAGGRARITMGGQRHPQEILREAQSLVTVLTHGAYKAPVHKVHDYEVGPSLGKDTIRAGTISFIIGAVLVVLFMVIYYSLSGMIADLAVLFNVIFIVAILISFNTALTMPGIAGIVLTIGMAVDANVLINERIREELRAGKTPRAAIDAGYSRAFSAILDSNLTTVIAAVILMNYSSGPIYGFAVTLLIGIATSFVTAVYVTRMIYTYWVEKGRLTKISI
jgi:preprotein translocase subunit SecD